MCTALGILLRRWTPSEKAYLYSYLFLRLTAFGRSRSPEGHAW